MFHSRRLAPLGFLILAFVSPEASGASDQAIERVSVASDGTQGNDESFATSLSADGRFVAFGSLATNLVADDTNGVFDVFVHDRQTGMTERVSVASDASQANSGSYGIPTLSGDGRFVAFGSYATNLVPGDTNGTADVFVHDRQTGMTERVSVASDGSQGNLPSSISETSLSADGIVVVFSSDAPDLVVDDTNGTSDVFVRDRQTGTTERVSVASDGSQGNGMSLEASISADGRFVVFASYASNLVANDTNGKFDVFLHDRQTGTTELVSVGAGGTQGDRHSGFGLLGTDLRGFGGPPVVSPDGRFVAFVSDATNLVSGDLNDGLDVFVRDRYPAFGPPVTLRRSAACSTCPHFDSDGPLALSSDGRFIVFHSNDGLLGHPCFLGGLIGGYNGVFIDDLGQIAESTAIVSDVPTDGDGACGSGGRGAALSADGRYVAFWSEAPLVLEDTNDVTDGYVRLVADVFATTTSSTTTSTTATTTTSTTAPTAFTTSSTAPTPTTASTTTTTNVSVTSTTLACDRNPRCAIDVARSSACAGEVVPTTITSKLERAATFIQRASAASIKKAHRLRRKASHLLKAGSRTAQRASTGKTPKLSSQCAAAIRSAAESQRQSLRSP